jgi:hypothetical protein
VTEIGDPASADAGLELLEQDAVQLDCQPLRARRVIVRLASASVLFQASNRRLRTTTTLHQGLLAYVTFGPQARGTVNGVPVRPGMLLAAAPDAEARFVVEPGWESITFLLPPEEIDHHRAARRSERDLGFPASGKEGPCSIELLSVRSFFQTVARRRGTPMGSASLKGRKVPDSPQNRDPAATHVASRRTPLVQSGRRPSARRSAPSGASGPWKYSR